MQKLITKSEVLDRLRVSAPTLWAWMRQGKFPKPIELSDTKVFWFESEVDAFIESRPRRQYKE